MTELRLSNRADGAAEAVNRRPFLWIFVATGVAVAGVAVCGFWAVSYFSNHFGNIDHSADTVQVTSLPPAPVLAGSVTTYNIPVETTYRNSKRGVSLKLPGAWRSLKDSALPDPPPAHRFCVLASQDGLDVMFWPIFPDLLPTLEADGAAMQKKFAEGGNFTLKGRRKLQVGGREALELQFSTSYGGFDMHLLIVRKWPTVYALAIIGSAKSDAAWKIVEDALPTSIEIHD